MIEMTPEQQAQLIAVFISLASALFVWFRSRLRQNARHHALQLQEQSDLHEQRIKDIEADREKDKNDMKIRFAEIAACSNANAFMPKT